MTRVLSLMILFVAILTSCNKSDKKSEVPISINTVEELDDIMDDCNDSRFQTKDELEDNLIGEWVLLGIRSGWINDFEKGDITLSIDKETIVLRDHSTGEVFETDWNLVFFEVNSYEYYYLETDEEGFDNRLGMETFCGDYMYGSGRVDDGNIYVYAKVE